MNLDQLNVFVGAGLRPDSPMYYATILNILAEADGETTTASQLAALLGLSAPSITRAIDNLEELRLVKTTVNPDNRTQHLITLTAMGKLRVMNYRRFSLSRR